MKGMIHNRNTRREFLGVLGGSLVGTALAAGSHFPVSGKPRIALSSVMFSHLPLEDFCLRARQLGFGGIDLWGPFGDCRHMAEAVKLGPAGFRRLLTRHQLELAVWTTYRTKGHEGGFPAFAEFIGECGGGTVVRESSYEGQRPEELEDSFRKFFTQLAPEIELAGKHKVRLVIENHSDAILDRAESFKIFNRLNPAPDVVKIGVAPHHLQKRKEDVAAVIASCGSQLGFFYAWQLAPGKGQLPGHGPADFRPWMEALAGIGYDRWLTPFMHGDLPDAEMGDAVTKSKDYLETILSSS